MRLDACFGHSCVDRSSCIGQRKFLYGDDVISANNSGFLACILVHAILTVAHILQCTFGQVTYLKKSVNLLSFGGQPSIASLAPCVLRVARRQHRPFSDCYECPNLSCRRDAATCVSQCLQLRSSHQFSPTFLNALAPGCNNT